MASKAAFPTFDAPCCGKCKPISLTGWFEKARPSTGEKQFCCQEKVAPGLLQMILIKSDMLSDKEAIFRT